MTDLDIKKITELVTHNLRNATEDKPKKREFSKTLMLFASVLVAATWIAAAASWFMWQEFPYELVRYTTWFYGTAIAFYMGKSGYENREKIKKGRDEKWES